MQAASLTPPHYSVIKIYSTNISFLSLSSLNEISFHAAQSNHWLFHTGTDKDVWGSPSSIHFVQTCLPRLGTLQAKHNGGKGQWLFYNINATFYLHGDISFSLKKLPLQLYRTYIAIAIYRIYDINATISSYIIRALHCDDIAN